jgi:hypothetical protein
VTYADEKMTRAQQLCMDSSLKYGVDDARGFSDSWWWHPMDSVDTFQWLMKAR